MFRSYKFLLKSPQSCTVSRFAQLATKASPEQPLRIYVLFYSYVDNILEKRVPHRAAHLEFANKHSNLGFLVAGGAFNPAATHGGMLLFRGSEEEVENFAKNDPYVKNNLVSSYAIKEWTVAVGEL